MKSKLPVIGLAAIGAVVVAGFAFQVIGIAFWALFFVGAGITAWIIASVLNGKRH